MKNIHNLKPFSLIFLLSSLILVFASCSDHAQSSGKSWEELKSDAKATYADAVELSKDKWNDLKTLTSEQWQEAGKSVVELKDKVVSAGKEHEPKLQQLVGEVENLQKEADQKLKAFGSASGDKVEASKEALEKTWKQLQEKIEELRTELKSV